MPKALSFLLIILLSSCISGPSYRGEKTDHFDGTYFKNIVPKEKSWWNLVKWAWERRKTKAKWPEQVKVEQVSDIESKVDNGVKVTFINHSTFLIQIAGLNILTDPIYSKRASPVKWIGPARHRLPGIAFKDLPPIDLVLISHNHYDHFDLDTIERLAKEKGNPKMIAGLGNAPLFTAVGADNHRTLDWWDTVRLKNLAVTFVPVQHWSGRGLTDRKKTLWGGYVIEIENFKIYFAGDTGMGPHFKIAADKWESFDLALLPIGAYEPRWMMKDNHMNPMESVEAHEILQSRLSIGMHYGTFQLTDEAIDAPLKDLEAARVAKGVSAQDFIVLDFGQSRFIEFENRSQADQAMDEFEDS